MSTYPVVKLLQLWKQEELTADQIIGHILQHVAMLEEQVEALQKAARTAPQERKP